MLSAAERCAAVGGALLRYRKGSADARNAEKQGEEQDERGLVERFHHDGGVCAGSGSGTRSGDGDS